MAARMAIMAITTSNSIRVKPDSKWKRAFLEGAIPRLYQLKGCDATSSQRSFPKLSKTALLPTFNNNSQQAARDERARQQMAASKPVANPLLNPNDGDRHARPGCSNAGVGEQTITGVAAGELKLYDIGVCRGNSDDKTFGKGYW